MSVHPLGGRTAKRDTYGRHALHAGTAHNWAPRLLARLGAQPSAHRPRHADGDTSWPAPESTS